MQADDQLRKFSNMPKGGKLRQFKPLQRDVIVAAASAKSDQNIVVHMHTGGGKSLIYQTLAALNEDGLCDSTSVFGWPISDGISRPICSTFGL